jgi:hypothetical protein
VGSHLLVLHDEAQSDALVSAARRLSAEDAGGLITLLVPTRFLSALGASAAARSLAASARRHALLVRHQLTEHGVTLASTMVTRQDTIPSVEQALRRSTYDSIVVAAASRTFMHRFRLNISAHFGRRARAVEIVDFASR